MYSPVGLLFSARSFARLSLSPLSGLIRFPHLRERLQDLPRHRPVRRGSERPPDVRLAVADVPEVHLQEEAPEELLVAGEADL